MKKKWILMAVVALLLALGGVALADEVEHDCNVLGHDWLWSSFYDGTHQGRCSVCGTQTIREAHTEGTICPVCGLRFDSGIGHNWQSNGNGTHSCTRCGVAAEACTGGEATCEHGAICEICGGEYTAKADHDWLWATFYDGTHQATCAECRVKTTREAHTVPEGMGVACSSANLHGYRSDGRHALRRVRYGTGQADSHPRYRAHGSHHPRLCAHLHQHRPDGGQALRRVRRNPCEANGAGHDGARL